MNTEPNGVPETPASKTPWFRWQIDAGAFPWAGGLFLGLAGGLVMPGGYPKIAISCVAIGLLLSLRYFADLSWRAWCVSIFLLSSAAIALMVRTADLVPKVSYSLKLSQESMTPGSEFLDIKWESGFMYYLIDVQNDSTTDIDDLHLKIDMPSWIVKPPVVLSQEPGAQIDTDVLATTLYYSTPTGTVAVRAFTNIVTLATPKLPSGRGFSAGIIMRGPHWCDDRTSPECGYLMVARRHSYWGSMVDDPPEKYPIRQYQRPGDELIDTTAPIDLKDGRRHAMLPLYPPPGGQSPEGWTAVGTDPFRP